MNRKMKERMNGRTNERSISVIHVLPTLGIGGAERVVCELVLGLTHAGFLSKIVTTVSGGPLEEWCREHGVVVEKLCHRDPFGWSTIRDLIHLFRRDQPMIVHTHLSGPDMWGRIAAVWTSVPVVVSTEHNTSPGTGWMKHGIKKMMARQSDAIVAVSKEVKRLLVARDGLPSNRIRVIPNGIDVSRVILRGSHGFHDIPRLICVGRLYPQKGHAVLFRALANISRPWQLWLVGDGPCAAELRRLAEDLGIASRMVWFGARNDVPQLLADADLFCFPSQWEGQGLAALEAAAAGVPVIASDLPEIHDMLSSHDAVFVPPASSEAWTKAIDTILRDPGPSIATAFRVAPVIQEQASQDKMIQAYAELYEKLMREKRLL